MRPCLQHFEYVCIKNWQSFHKNRKQKHLLTNSWSRKIRFSESEVMEIDFIGLIFMLSRIEERGLGRRLTSTKGLSVLHRSLIKNNWLDRPIVDECAQIVASFIASKPLKPISEVWNNVNSKDVDKLKEDIIILPNRSRYFLGDFLKRSRRCVFAAKIASVHFLGNHGRR